MAGDVIKVLLAGCGATGHLALAAAKVGALIIATACAATTCWIPLHAATLVSVLLNAIHVSCGCGPFDAVSKSCHLMGYACLIVIAPEKDSSLV